MASDPDGVGLAVLSSRIFVDWMKLIGGRIKSDVRFSSTFVYNTFPLPPIASHQRIALIEAAQQVLKARELYPNWSLAELYSDKMPPELVSSHFQVDKAVETIFSDTPMRVLQERQSALWRSYLALTDSGVVSGETAIQLSIPLMNRVANHAAVL